MTSPVRFQDAPSQYDSRDQVELRRVIAQQLVSLRQAIASQPVAELSIVVDGGDAFTSFPDTDYVTGGTAVE